jgi:hypothetical protein
VVEWSWTVTPTEPVDQELRLHLKPAVKWGEDRRSGVDGSTADYTTPVFVESTGIERVSYWFKTQWPPLTGVVAAIGAAILAVLAFSTKARDAFLTLLKRKPVARAESEQSAEGGARPNATEQQESKTEVEH